MLGLTFTFIVAALILLIGFLADILFRKTGFLDTLFLLVLGIAIGPFFGILSKCFRECQFSKRRWDSRLERAISLNGRLQLV
jgi:uncharacterized membrane protein YadS